MGKIAKFPVFLYIGLSFVLNLIIELCSRGSFSSLFWHITSYPLFFVFNCLFICTTLMIAQFFRRKLFLVIFISLLWLALGFINAYVLTYRVTPLCAIDFFILQISWNFIGGYVNTIQLILIGLAAALLIFLLILGYRRLPQSPVKYLFSTVKISICAGLAFILLILISLFGMSEPHLSDMPGAYEKYGFVYCFFRGSVERGIDEPKDYSKEAMEDKVNELETDADKNPKIKPNVIMLQLESFFDVNLLTDVKFNKNPVPNFTKLKKDYSHGRLTVPTVGAGTANSEFEVITGMSLEFFGSGEYPYKTILKSQTCETAPFNFLELGYSTFAVHSNNATFYDRNEVFPRLGFQTFLSSEYMVNAPKNAGNWIKDSYLTGQILKCLDSTKGSDYVYTISVQGHGAYPQEQLESPRIKITQSAMEESLTNQIEYYVNQVYEMDIFLKELTEALENYPEPTVLVMFGDHMPSLNFDSADLIFGDLFETEYVLWSNYEIKPVEKDLNAYQLSSYTMERIGMNNGLITKLHQNSREDSDYMDKLEHLEYDMLYGEKVSVGDNDFKPIDMKMGVDAIAVTNVYSVKDITVLGKNFTEQSYVFVNGNRMETAYNGSCMLTTPGVALKQGDIVDIRQISDDGVTLSSTNTFTVK